MLRRQAKIGVDKDSIKIQEKTFKIFLCSEWYMDFVTPRDLFFFSDGGESGKERKPKATKLPASSVFLFSKNGCKDAHH